MCKKEKADSPQLSSVAAFPRLKIMKIFATSDLHGMIDGLDPSGCDVVVVAGDFTKLNRFDKLGMLDQKKWVEDKFIPFTQKHPKTEFVVVPGNHDLIFDTMKTLIFRDINFSVDFPDNVHLLVNCGIELKGVKFWGSPNVPIINHMWAFESPHRELTEKFSMIPENVDILVTHSPPRIDGKYLDASLQYGGTRFFGSSELTEAILDKTPRFAFCGHIHSGSHEPCEFHKTLIHNVSRVDENYRIAYQPTVIEV